MNNSQNFNMKKIKVRAKAKKNLNLMSKDLIEFKTVNKSTIQIMMGLTLNLPIDHLIKNQRNKKLKKIWNK